MAAVPSPHQPWLLRLHPCSCPAIAIGGAQMLFLFLPFTAPTEPGAGGSSQTRARTPSDRNSQARAPRAAAGHRSQARGAVSLPVPGGERREERVREKKSVRTGGMGKEGAIRFLLFGGTDGSGSEENILFLEPFRSIRFQAKYIKNGTEPFTSKTPEPNATLEKEIE
ncbi:hypothetical protein GUJ93_ZPchr0002g25259 [Zizania palustris]|uniref:Uncharacterized protein n=1 Tax=Zizania palustris TaxID=103762 RepID=A0A8J5RHX3_ZIZPA|nr:hypothetical protein GUJ93_ZPchr0002g25259 [Zizania palustris]